jgi:hypothetical protein
VPIEDKRTKRTECPYCGDIFVGTQATSMHIRKTHTGWPLHPTEMDRQRYSFPASPEPVAPVAVNTQGRAEQQLESILQSNAQRIFEIQAELSRLETLQRERDELERQNGIIRQALEQLKPAEVPAEVAGDH